MTRAMPAAVLKWRPSERERKLLIALALVAATGFAAMALESLGQARSHHASAMARHSKLKQQFGQFSGDGLQARLAAQKVQLSSLRMSDQTPQISKLRMYEELLELAERAGLRNVALLDDGANELAPVDTAATFTAVETSLEADFEQAALTSFLRQLEDYHRAYLVEGIDIRLSPSPARMTLRLRILHQRPGSGR